MPDNTSGAFNTVSTGSAVHAYTSGVNAYSYEDREFNANNVVPTTDPVTGENRPKNIAVNLFVKINNNCE